MHFPVVMPLSDKVLFALMQVYEQYAFSKNFLALTKRQESSSSAMWVWPYLILSGNIWFCMNLN